MNDAELKKNAIKLHAEANGWLYRGAETVLEDEKVSKHVLLLWISRLEKLEKDSLKLYKAVETEQGKRAWVRAKELKVKMKERVKEEYGIV